VSTAIHYVAFLRRNFPVLLSERQEWVARMESVRPWPREDAACNEVLCSRTFPLNLMSNLQLTNVVSFVNHNCVYVSAPLQYNGERGRHVEMPNSVERVHLSTVCSKYKFYD
jgi:hypothetical protein